MKVPLVIFGCVHLGHESADIGMGKEYVSFVKKNKGYALLLADNHENAIPKKGHMMFSQTMDPQGQLDASIEFYRPIKDRIIGGCSGNHAGRSRQEAGLDMDKIMFDELGLSKKYVTNQGFVGLKVGKQLYRIAFRHGTGFGSNAFGNCIALSRAYPSADICAASHTHQMATTKVGHWKIDDKGKRKPHVVTFINTGSLLDFPRYADAAYYQPQPKGFAIAWLDSDKHSVEVDVSGEIE